MPLYEYECDACGHRFEVIQKIADPPIDRCPKCGATVHKLQSAPAFQFKGTGWYVTDYARKQAADGAKGDKGDGDAKPDAKADSKTDAQSKGEAKSDTKSDATESSGKGKKTDAPSKPASSSDSAASGSSTSKSS